MMWQHDCHNTVDQRQLHCLSWIPSDLKQPFIQRSLASLSLSHFTSSLSENPPEHFWKWISKYILHELLHTTSAATTLYLSVVSLHPLLGIPSQVCFPLASITNADKLLFVCHSLHISLQWLPITERIVFYQTPFISSSSTNGITTF